jgi:hypothetical protein
VLLSLKISKVISIAILVPMADSSNKQHPRINRDVKHVVYSYKDVQVVLMTVGSVLCASKHMF